MNEHIMSEEVNYYVITNTGTTFPASLDGIPVLSIKYATKEDIEHLMEGVGFTATMDKESAKRFISIMFPNNWLKMHGFPKRRKVRN